MPMCDAACQVGSTHYNECQILRTLKEKLSVKSFEDKSSPIYQCITPLRLLMKKNTHPKWFRRLTFLMDHREAREQEEKMWDDHQKNVVDFLIKACNLNFTRDDIMWAIGILKTNTIMFGETGGRALFPMFSLINHSCRANAKHTLYIKNRWTRDKKNNLALLFLFRRIAVQAQTDIKQGEEICINYVTFIIGTIMRQTKLQKNWYFKCSCERCSDPTELGSHLSSLRCPKCDNGFLTQVSPLNPESPWKCSVHNFLYSKENVESLIVSLKRHLFSEGEGGTTPQQMEEVLEMFSQFLHPHHYLMMITKRNIISLYSQLPLKMIAKKDFLRIKELCEESIEVLGKVDPGYPLWKAETLKVRCTFLFHKKQVRYPNRSCEAYNWSVELWPS